MRVFFGTAVAGVCLFGAACGGTQDTSGDGGGGGSTASQPECVSNQDCAGTPDTPYCDSALGDCAPPPLGGAIGWGDGSPGSAMLTVVFEPDKLSNPTDLQFNPSVPNELWIVNRADDTAIVLWDAGTPTANWVRKHDPAASHFMHFPPAIAFGSVIPDWSQTFAVCGDGDNGGDDFMGPALFTADLAVFAKQTPGGLGSHLDMLHSTTFCRGIAHQEASVYWTFNSNKRSLDKYDFHLDHDPGNEDHSDGEIFRYAEGLVLGVDGFVSHLSYRPEDKQLYVADTGNKRVAKLDTTTGTPGPSFSGFEPVKTRRKVLGAAFVDLVPAGTLEAPAGIEVKGDLLYVSDTAQSRFYAFDLNGLLVRTFDTGLPAGSLAGFTFGADGKIYFVDSLSSRVYRIDPI